MVTWQSSGSTLQFSHVDYTRHPVIHPVTECQHQEAIGHVFLHMSTATPSTCSSHQRGMKYGRIAPNLWHNNGTNPRHDVPLPILMTWSLCIMILTLSRNQDTEGYKFWEVLLGMIGCRERSQYRPQHRWQVPSSQSGVYSPHQKLYAIFPCLSEMPTGWSELMDPG